MSGKTPALAIEAQAPKAAYNREEDILESLIDLQKRGSGVEPAAERGRGGGGWPRDPMALLEYREAVQSAKAAFASLPGERDGKTVARVEGGEAVESGVVDRPGFEGKAETVGKVGASSLEAGHEGERHPFDNRDPGQLRPDARGTAGCRALPQPADRRLEGDVPRVPGALSTAGGEPRRPADRHRPDRDPRVHARRPRAQRARGAAEHPRSRAGTPGPGTLV